MMRSRVIGFCFCSGRFATARAGERPATYLQVVDTECSEDVALFGRENSNLVGRRKWQLQVAGPRRA